MANFTVGPIGAGLFIYPDRFGVNHTVSTNSSFRVLLTDNSATDVQWRVARANAAGNVPESLPTTDGYTIFPVPDSENASGTGGNATRKWGCTADTQDATKTYGLAGELVFKCPVSGINQYFKASHITVDNVDAPSSISGRFEDQFGNSFSWASVTCSSGA